MDLRFKAISYKSETMAKKARFKTDHKKANLTSEFSPSVFAIEVLQESNCVHTI